MEIEIQVRLCRLQHHPAKQFGMVPFNYVAEQGHRILKHQKYWDAVRIRSSQTPQQRWIIMEWKKADDLNEDTSSAYLMTINY